MPRSTVGENLLLAKIEAEDEMKQIIYPFLEFCLKEDSEAFVSLERELCSSISGQPQFHYVEDRSVIHKLCVPI